MLWFPYARLQNVTGNFLLLFVFQCFSILLSCYHQFSILNGIPFGHSPLVSFQYTEQTEVWISLSFSSAIIQPIRKVEMITQLSLVDTSHWSLRQLSSSIIILAVQIRNIDYPRNSWISPIKAINFEMTVLKTKQFNGIQFGSVRPDFLDYNYIGGHN